MFKSLSLYCDTPSKIKAMEKTESSSCKQIYELQPPSNVGILIGTSFLFWLVFVLFLVINFVNIQMKQSEWQEDNVIWEALVVG